MPTGASHSNRSSLRMAGLLSERLLLQWPCLLLYPLQRSREIAHACDNLGALTLAAVILSFILASPKPSIANGRQAVFCAAITLSSPHHTGLRHGWMGRVIRVESCENKRPI